MDITSCNLFNKPMRPEKIRRFNEYFKSKSKDDEDFIMQTFSDDSNEESLRELSRTHWDQTTNEKLDLRHILQKIHQNIQKKDSGSNSNKLIMWYNRVAAVLLVPILVSSIYFGINYYQANQLYSEIRAPKGSKVQFLLPDGSTGYLNGGSSLSYTANFKKNRKIELNGEAYFEVEKDKKHPFLVQTDLADVEVLGTTFDVRAYKADDEILTTLVEGSVKVFNKNSRETSLLKPGQQNRIELKSGKMTNTTVNTNYYTSWKEAILRFDGTPFAEVLKQMERWYGVEFIIASPIANTQKYTMTIKTESLREVLQLMSLTTDFNFKIDGEKVIINSLNN